MNKKYLLIVLALYITILFAQTAIQPSAGDGSADNLYQIASMGNIYWI